MRTTFHLGQHGASVTFHREDSDPKFWGIKHAKGEHALFHHLKRWLNQRGFFVIKKRAQDDGHLIGDQYQPYLRTTGPKSTTPHVMIYSGFYALRGAEEDWNDGTVTLILVPDAFERG